MLDKILPLAVYPVGLTIVGGIVALALSLTGFVRTSRAILAAAVAVLWISSTPIFANWLYGALEAEYPPVAIEDLPRTDVAIVLGGVLGRSLPPHGVPDAGEAFDRVLHAARVYRAGRVDAVLASGGNLPWLAASTTEAELIGDLLVELGVPSSAIAVERDSRNTRENAANTADVMASRGWTSAVLVTSAAHMPRALAAFEKAGIAAVPAPTDFRVTYPLYENVLDLLPDVDAVERSTDALKELLGMLVYRLRGWA